MEEVTEPYELPLWIIISAAVAGILLLGIIILILWKVSLLIANHWLYFYGGNVSRPSQPSPLGEVLVLTHLTKL